MNLLKFIFGPASPEKTANKIIDRVLISSFRVFKDEEIRKMLKFSTLEMQEQDRIYNEFTVTGLVLACLMIETVSQVTEGEKHAFVKEVKNHLFTLFLNKLSEFGIKRKYVNLWGKLLEMRCDEYRQDRNNYRGHVPEPSQGNPWISIVAIGGLHHLRRGKTSPEDPLFKHLLSWLSSLAIDIEKIMIRSL